MRAKKHRGFKGIINGVFFYDEHQFNTVEYLLEQIEDKFDECYDNSFVADLDHVIETICVKVDDSSMEDIEREFYDSIDQVEADGQFTDLIFKYYGSDYRFEWFNKNIRDGVYVKTEADTADPEPTVVLLDMRMHDGDQEFIAYDSSNAAKDDFINQVVKFATSVAKFSKEEAEDYRQQLVDKLGTVNKNPQGRENEWRLDDSNWYLIDNGIGITVELKDIPFVA